MNITSFLKHCFLSKGSVFGTRGHRFIAVRRCGDAVDVAGVVARRRLGRSLLAPPALHHEQRRTDFHRRQLRFARFVCQFFLFCLTVRLFVCSLVCLFEWLFAMSICVSIVCLFVCRFVCLSV